MTAKDVTSLAVAMRAAMRAKVLRLVDCAGCPSSNNLISSFAGKQKIPKPVRAKRANEM